MKTETLTRILTRLDSIGRFCGYVAMAMIVLMIGCMIWEVVARKAFNAPTMWATTTSYMFNGTIFLICAAYTLRAAGSGVSGAAAPGYRTARQR